MNRILPVIMTACVALLSACSQKPQTPVEQMTSDDASLPVVEASASMPPIMNEDAVTEESSASNVVDDDSSGIPKTLQGRWGLVAADCTSTRGDAKGLLEVSADQLKFYEAVAKMGTIKEAGGTRIRASFSYSGEGQSWTQDVVLATHDGGKTLTRRDYGPDAAPGPLTYSRCS